MKALAPLETRVRRAYAAASENGYAFDNSAAFARDMVLYDADLESEDPSEIAPIIDAIKSEVR